MKENRTRGVIGRRINMRLLDFAPRDFQLTLDPHMITPLPKNAEGKAKTGNEPPSEINDGPNTPQPF